MTTPEHDSQFSDPSLEELLVLYADGELEGEDLARVEAWLTESPRARQLLEQHRLIGDRIAGWTDSATLDKEGVTLERVHARLDRDKVIRFWRIAVAAAAVVLVATLGFRWANDPDRKSSSDGTGAGEIAQSEPAPELLENLDVLEELSEALADTSDPSALDDELVDLLLEEVAILDESPAGGKGDDQTDTSPSGALPLDPSLYDFWLEEEVSGGG